MKRGGVPLSARRAVSLFLVSCGFAMVLSSLAVSRSAAEAQPAGLSAYTFTVSGHGSATYLSTLMRPGSADVPACEERGTETITWSFAATAALPISPGPGLPESLEFFPRNGSLSDTVTMTGSCPDDANPADGCGTRTSTTNSFTLPVAVTSTAVSVVEDGLGTGEQCPYQDFGGISDENAYYVSGPSSAGSGLTQYCTTGLDTCDFPPVIEISGSSPRTYCEQSIQTPPGCLPPEETSGDTETWNDTSDTWQLTIDATPLLRCTGLEESGCLGITAAQKRQALADAQRDHQQLENGKAAYDADGCFPHPDPEVKYACAVWGAWNITWGVLENQDGAIYDDPPAGDYAHVAKPGNGGSASAGNAVLNRLTANLSAIKALAAALTTDIDRISGAVAAGQSAAAHKQKQAFVKDARKLSATLELEPALARAAAAVLHRDALTSAKHVAKQLAVLGRTLTSSSNAHELIAQATLLSALVDSNG